MLGGYNLSLVLLGLASAVPGVMAASAGCGKAATLATGVQKLTVQGKTRQYTLQLPANYDPSHPYRVIFGWHGANDNMDTTVKGSLVQPPGSFRYFGLEKQSNNTAILVAPDALNKAWYNRNNEDYSFYDAMLAQLSAGLCVDDHQIFSIGFSHGGAFVKALSCKRDTLRGVIILDGGGPIDGSTGCSDDPIGAMVVHGVNDGIAGGRATRDLYVQRNGCTGPASAKEPAVNSRAPHILTEYQGCKEGYPVWFVAFDGQHWMAPFDGGSGNNGDKTFTPGIAWRFITQFT